MYARTRVGDFPCACASHTNSSIIKYEETPQLLTINKIKMKKNLFAALLLLVAGLQTAWAQGFRVYQSDGTQLQFSLSTDSIVFDNGLSGDEVFGPFTPVNLCIAGTWYKSRTESVTFNEDGTTDYLSGATYEFMPYQGSLVIFNSSGTPVQVLRVPRLTDDMLLLATGASPTSFDIYTRTRPVLLVTGITLSDASLNLRLNETKQLTATVLPEDADNKAVTWESSNTSVAAVIRTGKVTAKAMGTCTITCSAKDGSGIKAECQVTVQKDKSGTIDGRDYVDLGLPSGTLWATCNVGASSPEEYGDYFAWGETVTKDTYNWSTYFDTEDNGSTFKKYNNNGGLTELLPEHDAATANWGSVWQMPSLDQIEELINSDYTTTEWTTQGGVSGHKITSKSNGNSVFLPAAGYRYVTSLYDAGSYGVYWSRSLKTSYSSYAYRLYFYSFSVNWLNDDRYYGRSVRPVRVK